MSPRFHFLTIDARPRGPNGPYASWKLLGRSVLERHVATALQVQEGPVVVVGETDLPISDLGDNHRIILARELADSDGPTLRTDRLYDAARLRRTLRRGRDPDVASIWRLDGPGGLAAAESEIIRRQSYQPIGKYWALGPARAIARVLRPTFVRPNAVTLTAAAFMGLAATLVAQGGPGWSVAVCLAVALVLDTADGHLARLQGTASEFGRRLDEALDEAADMAFHAAISWWAYLSTGAIVWLLVGMGYGMGKYLFRVVSQSEPGPIGQSGEPGSEMGLRSLVRYAGHADVRWHLWIVLAAFGHLEIALAAYAVYFPTRAFANLIGKAVRRG